MLRKLLPVVALIAVIMSACAPVSASLDASPTPIPILPPVPSPLAPLPTMPGCRPGNFDLTLQVGDQERTFLLHIPGRLVSPLMLVIALHGVGGNSHAFEHYTGFSRIADQQGFIAAYPQALGESPAWNLEATNNPDISFIEQMIDDIQSRCPISQNKVYAMGHSRGGGFANRLACNIPNRLAAIGTVAGAFGFWTECNPADAVPVIAIHGLDDVQVPYGGRPKLPTNAFSTPPVLEWAKTWASRNGCIEKPESTQISAKVQLDQWSGCNQRANVILYSLAKTGHEWPSSPFNASQALLDFFKQH